MTAGNQIIKNRCSVLFLFLFLVLLPPCVHGAAGDGGSQEMNGNTEKLDLTFGGITEGGYEYQIEGRSDPFVPFFTGESTTGSEPDPNEIIETKERLTGMQLFEPGQLTLVALMAVNGKYVAMVEDFKGQGYVIREGTKIGRRGVVKDIARNKVLIEEIALTRSGKELRSEIVMALRKEGEE